LGVEVGSGAGRGGAWTDWGTIRQVEQKETLSTTWARPLEKSSSLRLFPQIPQ
jgi:hypothetical protein